MKQETTVKELDQLHAKMVEARAAHADLKNQATVQWNEYKKLEADMIARLEELGRTEYKCPTGSFYFTYPVYHKMADKDKFFGFVREQYGQDALNGLISVHAQTLNAFVKSAVEDMYGADSDIAVPGINSTVKAAQGHLLTKK